jgi:hypothetical protein
MVTLRASFILDEATGTVRALKSSPEHAPSATSSNLNVWFRDNGARPGILGASDSRS